MTIYDIYDQLCKYRRELKTLSKDTKQFTRHQRFMFLNEIQSLDGRIRVLEKRLSIQVVGDVEFSHLYASVILNKTPVYYTPQIEWKPKSPWQKIKEDPERMARYRQVRKVRECLVREIKNRKK